MKGLADRNHVDLLALAQEDETLNNENLQHLKGLCRSVEIIQGPPKSVGFPMLWRLFRSLVSKKPYTIWRHYSAELENRVKDITRETHYDVVHFDVLPVAVYRRAVVQGLCSITDHDVCYVKTLRIARGTKNLLLWLFLHLESLKLYLFEKSLTKNFDLVIAVSELDAEQLERASGHAGVLIIPNGVDTVKFFPGKEDETEDYILWVGGLSYYPNYEAVNLFLDEIFPLINKRLISAKVIVVGEYRKVEKFVRKYKSKEINFVGFVDDVEKYIRRAKIFIAPIKSGSGTRLKLLEAMAMGKAIVTTTIGREGIEGMNGEEFIVADDSVDFANCVIEVLKDQKLRERLGKKARNLVERKYDWEIIATELRKVITKNYDNKVSLRIHRMALDGR